VTSRLLIYRFFHLPCAVSSIYVCLCIYVQCVFVFLDDPAHAVVRSAPPSPDVATFPTSCSDGADLHPYDTRHQCPPCVETLLLPTFNSLFVSSNTAHIPRHKSSPTLAALPCCTGSILKTTAPSEPSLVRSHDPDPVQQFPTSQIPPSACNTPRCMLSIPFTALFHSYKGDKPSDRFV
jgi:hypothetical protein